MLVKIIVIHMQLSKHKSGRLNPAYISTFRN